MIFVEDAGQPLLTEFFPVRVGCFRHPIAVEHYNASPGFSTML